MRLTIMAFLFCLIPSVVNAQAFQYDHPMMCEKIETVLQNLFDKYGEKPIWSGKDKDGSGAVLVENTKNKTWTLIKFNKDFACIYAVGEESKLELGQPV